MFHTSVRIGALNVWRLHRRIGRASNRASEARRSQSAFLTGLQTLKLTRCPRCAQMSADCAVEFFHSAGGVAPKRAPSPSRLEVCDSYGYALPWSSAHKDPSGTTSRLCYPVQV